MIEVMDLTKAYGSTRAVSGLTFDVRPGQVTGFLGHNGAGKSTTMRMILGLHAPTSGQALINGVRKHDLRDPMREVGAMLDATEVQGGRTALDHLQALAYAGGISRRRVVRLLEEVGLAGVARKRIAGFSQGMRQRLGIAAALLGDPGVLILDEPVNGLDPDGIRWLRTLLRSLAAEGRTILLSSHLMTEMSLTADRLIIIGHGRLIEDTTTPELLARFQDEVLVRSPHASRLATVLEAAGATVRAAPPPSTYTAGTAVRAASSAPPGTDGTWRAAAPLDAHAAAGGVHIAPSGLPAADAARVAPPGRPEVDGRRPLAPPSMPEADHTVGATPSGLPGAAGNVRQAPPGTRGADGRVRVAPPVTRGTDGKVRVAPPGTVEADGRMRVAPPSTLAAGEAVYEPGGEEGLLVAGMSAAAIGDAALRSGCSIHELTPQQVSLEEAFMELTR
ncbi:ATP-binding cassette domain-containing protein [Nonomuraea sp. FMUSA5-5]|uniref:ATP-binding cassette domain-containing protein n=1 Tax=Nonomuraea composti TaxID=2720023 RepID=A0ABX1B5E2_9ACTN|nr:ATP-binding cassette domain-containing protein [Nonomuraea sp. FMUSA5-5]